MIISAENSLDAETLSRGRHWQWKSYGALQWIWIAGGTILIASGVVLLASPEKPWGIYFMVFGVWCLIRKWILGLRSKSNWKKIPGYGKPIQWQFEDTFLRQYAGESSSIIKLSDLLLVQITPDGFLLYPQKGIFYWLPKSGFSSESDFDAAVLLVKLHAKWKELR